jgi:hypothetical protein
MEEFKVAGSTFGEGDERLLTQVVQIAGYTSGIRELVRDSFRFCHVHGVSIPKEKGRSVHARCASGIKPAVPGPRAAPR